jgi:dipeptidyl aminopeptidase/acylaminoacyl peptidase
MLKKIEAPTLIIHGSDDLLIKPSHSKKMASLIHGSKLFIIKGMGHDFNKNFKKPNKYSYFTTFNSKFLTLRINYNEINNN